MSDAAARQRRAKQTVNNLVYSLLATAAVVVVMILITPRPDSNLVPPVDYKKVAAEASAQSGHHVVAPALPGKGWYSNSARWNVGASDGVDNWYLGFVGPKGQYLGITQAFNSNPTWVALQLAGDTAIGARKIGGRTWTVWKNLSPGDIKHTKDYAFVTDLPVAGGIDQVIIYGTAPHREFVQFANNVAGSLNVLYR